MSSAETLDVDNDGKIDHYKLTFNENVTDSTFPGYSENGTGSATTAWLVAAYTNIKLVHGTAVSFDTDTANDDVLFITFDENSNDCNSSSQTGCDTGAKPDLTTTASPVLTDIAGTVIAQVNTSPLAESDSAKPIVAKAEVVDNTHADITFSEDVDQTAGEDEGNYSINNGLSATAAARDGVNHNVIHLTTSAQTDATVYTVTVTGVTDTATNTVNTSSNIATFTGIEIPTVSSVNVTSSITFQVIFSESMLAGVVGVVTGTGECANTTECSVIYNVPGLTVTSSVSNAGSGNNSTTFNLTVSEQVEGNSYTLTVTSGEVKDSTDGTAIGASGNTKVFTGDGKPLAVVDGSGCVSGPPCTILVAYDQNMTTGSATSADVDFETNYVITSCDGGTCANASQTATSVSWEGGTNTATVNFGSSLSTDGTSLYSMTISNVEDSSNNAIAADTIKTFNCGSDTVSPTLSSAEVLSNTQLLLTFSEAIDSATANVTTNYNIDGNGVGINITSATRQANTEQVKLVLSSALGQGGHNIVVINVDDLSDNVIVNDDIGNKQPFTINPPQTFDDGPVFEDPFSDSVETGQIFIFDGKLYVGPDATEGAIFEMSSDMSSSQIITIDADGTPGIPYTTFDNLDGDSGWTAVGIDSFYSACLGLSPSTLTGSNCTGAGVVEANFIGAYITDDGGYDSIWMSIDTGTVRTYEEIFGLETGGNAFRSMSNFVFKDQLYIGLQDQGGGAIKFSRICVNPLGCANGDAYKDVTQLIGKNLPRMAIDNGAKGNTLIAVDSMWEYDNDDSGTNPSQLYMANGGYITDASDLVDGDRADGKWDGGILRTQITYSTADTVPDGSTITYWEDMTPSSSKWLSYMSIALPKDAEGDGVCGTETVGDTEDWDCLVPQNKITPAIKAVPYMRTAPNGDLYLIRNACTSITVQTLTSSIHQTCPSESEVPQLWMLPKGSTATPSDADDWILVAEAPSANGRTDMSGNNAALECGSSPNICDTENTHITLLEFSGNYLYIGFDNTSGINIWRVDFNNVAGTIPSGDTVVDSGEVPTEGSFNLVHTFGLGDVSNNTRIFSNVTVDDSGVDYMVITTGNGANAIRIFRTKNEN